jgi:hypothetical protein
VVLTGGEYVVGTVLDHWFVVPPDAVRRFLAKLLNAAEEARCSLIRRDPARRRSQVY